MGSGSWGNVELLTETRSFPCDRKRYQPLDAWRERLEKILEYYADLPESYGEVITYVVGSRDRSHFMLIHEGWENHLRVHDYVVHAEIGNDKI